MIQSDFQADLFFVGGRPQHGNGLLNQFAERDAAGLDAQLAALGAGGFEQIADHGVQLVHAFQNGFQMVGLFGRHGARQAVQQESYVLVNAGERRAQFVRHVREKAILEFQLLLLADFQRPQQRLPFDGVAHGALQILAGDVALDQVILHAVMDGLHGQHFVILAGEHDDRDIGRVFHEAAESFSAVAVGKVQVEQHQRRRFPGQRSKAIGQAVYAIHFDVRLAFHQAQADQVRVSRIVFNQQHVRGLVIHILVIHIFVVHILVTHILVIHILVILILLVAAGLRIRTRIPQSTSPPQKNQSDCPAC